MLVGVGPIHDPPAIATAGAGREPESPMELRQIGIFHADEMEFALRGKVRRGTLVVAFKVQITEPLSERGAGNQQSHRQDQADAHETAFRNQDSLLTSLSSRTARMNIGGPCRI